ncbi:expressed unknown protein [Seminavis robusta]|uniref:Uncharacterized protein n=1 Tax=Seminavis robusta TaxID=568900 RepID=A0A9N8HLH5_9STRA|nr:expressed unknown protein [Seminavis robusta]|eukprot:Sro810_g205720.1 n/a (733) ;mRNA; f:12446-14731
MMIQPSIFFLFLPSLVFSQGLDLGGGVITRTNVDLLANLALDLRDIRASQDPDTILRLYLDGRNAEDTPGFYYPLKKLADTMSEEEKGFTPNYIFHLYGLADLSEDDYTKSLHYSDRSIRSTITTKTELTADAIVALDTWMYATHVLHKGVDLCSRRAAADDPDRLEDLGGGGMDEFIALWIGKEQTPASSEGHSLYALSQDVGQYFGTNLPEAQVNEDLKLLYQQGAGVLSLPHACTKEGDATGVQQLWNVAQQMISKMYIPLVQMLIHSLVIEDEDLAALYAMAIVPQVSQCQPSVYKRLHGALLTGNVNFAKKNEILNDIDIVIDCLGLTCDDIGTYRDETYSCSAANKGSVKALAGYYPTTNVHSYAKLDLDILQLRILTSLDSWHFARYIYQFGRNSLKERDSDNDVYELLSLHELAVAVCRKKADPLYSYYVAYFNQVNYADIAVDEALRGVGKWKTKEQRREVIVATCAFQIVFLYLIAEVKETVQQCRDPAFDPVDASMHPWDEVAALLVGSLEGPQEGGSSDIADGQLIFNLANSRAFQFQTLTDEGYSQVNSDLDDLLFAGKGELDAKDCDNLESTAQRIEKLAIVPMIQSAMRYAVALEKLDNANDSVEAALGEVFAFSVLPILFAADSESAEVIRENMEVMEGTPSVRNGAQTVADAFGAAVEAWGLACPNLGYTSNADPCLLQGGHSKPRSYSRSAAKSCTESIAWLSTGITLLVWLAL